ncbi:spermatogenesis-associated protein 5-like protein 1 [Nilaparvata lugens]|uniref:spermatogenesis-associated protein 5-like protein 1 n=1 Tax=Nilaparvata lugens TaxID=108931 RepID=UPI00193D043C|nr:spermatogenesis-associated protein 5-like protein 1 [Nilaparvata lugens]
MGVPSLCEREEMLRNLCLKMEVDDRYCKEIAEKTPGFVAADLSLLVLNAQRKISKLPRQPNKDEVRKEWLSVVCDARPSVLRGEQALVSEKAIDLSDIGGLQQSKISLQKAVEWPLFYHDSMKRLGIMQSKGVLLYGPPGCAKTSLVCAIASKLNITFLSISAAAIYSPYVGDAERTISQLFRRARLSAPSVLFIDEIDALVGSRGLGMHKVSESVLSTLLTEMDGVGVKLEKSIDIEESFQPKVVVVAATNRPNLLDPALVRPGRFDRLVYVGPPDRHERLEILQKLTRKIPLGSSVNLEELASKTSMFSGADLSSLCKEAALIAMCEGGMNVEYVEQSHWLKALESMEPSLTQEQIDCYSNISFK